MNQEAGKKYNTNKKSPFEDFDIDNNKLLNSPSFLKIINGSSDIETISPIYISNLNEEQYTNNKNFCVNSISMSDDTQMHKPKTINFMFNKDDNLRQVGLKFQFKGVMVDLYVVYNFELGWLTNEIDNNSFTEWLKETSENKSICIISPSIKGWGKSKLVNAVRFLSQKLETLEDTQFNIDNSVTLKVSNNVTSVERKTKLIQKKNPTITELTSNKGLSPSIDELIKIVLGHQENVNKLIEQQAHLMQQLNELKQAS